MGGWGSGFYSRYNAKDTVESCRRLSLKRLCEAKAIKPHAHTAGNWQWTRDGEIVSWISYKSDTLISGQEHFNLTYTITNTGEKHDYKVWLKTTQPHYGGIRYWFACPCCQKRTTMLYMKTNLFVCRKCANLTYQSQQENKSDRLLEQARKIHKQLGGDGAVGDIPEPSKPKWMHWKTYHYKLAKMYQLNLESDILAYRRWGY